MFTVVSYIKVGVFDIYIYIYKIVYTRTVYFKNALSCKFVILKKAIAETSILIWWLKIL